MMAHSRNDSVTHSRNDSRNDSTRKGKEGKGREERGYSSMTVTGPRATPRPVDNPTHAPRQSPSWMEEKHYAGHGTHEIVWRSVITTDWKPVKP